MQILKIHYSCTINNILCLIFMLKYLASSCQSYSLITIFILCIILILSILNNYKTQPLKDTKYVRLCCFIAKIFGIVFPLMIYINRSSDNIVDDVTLSFMYNYFIFLAFDYAYNFDKIISNYEHRQMTNYERDNLVHVYKTSLLFLYSVVVAYSIYCISYFAIKNDYK